MKEINTLLLIVIGVLLLWLVTSGRINNVGPAWRVLMARGAETGGGSGRGGW
jgi:hypothetical protein